MEAELRELSAYASQTEGREIELCPWDYSYYANKLKTRVMPMMKRPCALISELGNVIDGVFGLATRLYGVTFRENNEIPVYHPDVRAYEVIDRDGSFLGIIYNDFFPRDSKAPRCVDD